MSFDILTIAAVAVVSTAEEACSFRRHRPDLLKYQTRYVEPYTLQGYLIVQRSVLNRVPKQYGTNIVGYSAHNAYVAFDTKLLKFRVRFCRFRSGMSILPILDLY